LRLEADDLNEVPAMENQTISRPPTIIEVPAFGGEGIIADFSKIHTAPRRMSPWVTEIDYNITTRRNVAHQLHVGLAVVAR